MSTGWFIRQQREACGLTQHQLARLAHTSQSCISRYEKGHMDPSVGTLRHLLEAMGLDLILDAKPLAQDNSRDTLTPLMGDGIFPYIRAKSLPKDRRVNSPQPVRGKR